MKKPGRDKRIHAPFETLKLFSDKPEVNLFKAIILQMLSDLMIKSKNRKYLKHKEASQQWFFSDNDDFEIICENANIDPKIVRKLASSIFKKDLL